MKFCKSMIVILSILGWLTPSFSQVSGDPSDPTAIGFSKKKTHKVSSWSFITSTSWSRPLVTKATETMSVSANAIYKKFKSFNLSFNVGGFRSLVRYSPDPSSDQSLTDFRTSIFLKPQALKNKWLKEKGITPALSLSLALPTSQNSKAQTRQASISFGSLFFKRIAGGINLGTGLRGFYSKHKYTNFAVEAKPEVGFAPGPFSYLGFSMPFSVSKSFKTKTFVNLSYNLATNLNYDSDWISTNSLSASVSQVLRKKIIISGSYSWGDRIETDNSIFMAEAVRASVSLSYRF